jgi:branched-chain amino acid transport system substrate-binding protein
VIASVTGSGAFASAEDLTAIRIIENVVNARGGIRGRQLHFAIEDDQTNPALGVQLVNELIAKKTTYFLGPTITAVCSAILPLIRESGPVTYCYSPGIHPTQGSYMFSVGASTRDQAAVTAKFIHDRHWTKIGLITSTDASGQDFENKFNDILTDKDNAGLSIVDREHFAVSDLSVAAQITRIKAADAQVIIAWTIGTGFGTTLRAIKDLGVETPVVGGLGNAVYAQLAQYAPIMPKELYFPGMRGMSLQVPNPRPIHAKQVEYYDAFTKASVRPDGPATLAWDSTLLFLDTLQQLGVDAGATQMRDYIRQRRGWVGINGVYDFSDPEQRGLSALACVVYRYDPAQQNFVPVTKPGGAI